MRTSGLDPTTLHFIHTPAVRRSLPSYPAPSLTCCSPLGVGESCSFRILRRRHPSTHVLDFACLDDTGRVFKTSERLRRSFKIPQEHLQDPSSLNIYGGHFMGYYNAGTQDPSNKVQGGGGDERAHAEDAAAAAGDCARFKVGGKLQCLGDRADGVDQDLGGKLFKKIRVTLGRFKTSAVEDLGGRPLKAQDTQDHKVPETKTQDQWRWKTPAAVGGDVESESRRSHGEVEIGKRVEALPGAGESASSIQDTAQVVWDISARNLGATSKLQALSSGL
ncbi:hypothetical protein DFH07DRAFT_767246 [Mycena maculata]|uniref:Uncharacterized protein n=1 Tax=Mycena maculata TaxID=230809 RepID=A0AAD7NTE1_9AGAR|nr:hypothetical protein DFH07DRAFT_767246 [Mycena maculata]